MPKKIHDSGAQPSRVQETPDDGQVGQSRIIEQSHSRRVRSSLWGDMIERNLRFSSESELG